MTELLPGNRGPWVVFLAFLRLGLTSFGGPVAHLGYFRDEFVSRRAWLAERDYADLVALCQFLPGPASSQVGIGIGLSRCGLPGALAAWAGFTLPSAILLVLFALGLAHSEALLASGALQGLKVAAVAVVAQAVWGMARSFCTDGLRIGLMALAAGFVLLAPFAWAQAAAILAAGIAGRFFLAAQAQRSASALALAMGRRSAVAALCVFFLLLLGLPMVAGALGNPSIAMVDAFYRAGSLVFGGGHVVLPLLQAEVVAPGWVGNDPFLAGYGAAQAVPGPLFTFAAFLGAVAQVGPGGWSGGLVALLAIFLPSFLLLAGVLPFWERLRGNAGVRAALAGVNAAVVGLLLAALYTPVWTGAIRSAPDFVMALAAFLALAHWRLPAWLVVAACAAAGWIFGVAS